MQKALAEILLLALPAGLLGSWVVLRRLAFFTHSVGPAAFPAIVVADAYGLGPQPLAIGSALLYAPAVEFLSRGRERAVGVATGLILITSLALGSLLASDVFHSSGQVDTLLFGSLFATSWTDLAVAAAVASVALLLTFTFGRNWQVGTFDAESARATGVNEAAGSFLLVTAVAVSVVIAIPAVGALLTTGLFVVPAATARLFAGSLRALIAGSVAVAMIEGPVALWLSYWLNLPPGATLAVLACTVFLAALGLQRLVGR